MKIKKTGVLVMETEVMVEAFATTISGEASIDFYRVMKEFINEETEEGQSVIFNFNRVKFIGSSSLGSIVALKDYMHKKNQRLVIKNASDDFLALLKITCLTSVMKIISGEDSPSAKEMKALRKIVDENGQRTKRPIRNPYRPIQDYLDEKKEDKNPLDNAPKARAKSAITQRDSTLSSIGRSVKIFFGIKT